MSGDPAERRPCAGLWNTPMVYVNGDVTTCCLDQHLLNRIGNLREESLKRIWQGETVHAWRLAHVEGRYQDSGPYCTACNWRSAGTMPDEKIEAWLGETGEAAVLARWRALRGDRDAG